MSRKSNTRVVKTYCRICLSCCGIDAHVEDGRLVKVTPMKEHPVNKLCVKAQAIPDLIYSPQRITHPMRKVDGEWRKISWEEAFAFITERLNQIREDYGAKALVVHQGEPIIATEAIGMAQRFCSLFGTPNYTSGGSLCFAAKGIGYGLSFSRHMFPLAPSYENARCVVVWGHNPHHSKLGEEIDILKAQSHGAKLIVVDPRLTPLARRADLHIQVKPGADCALALGLMNVIITEGLYDKDFVHKWTYGFDKLVEHVQNYPPEIVEQVTWVPADKIRQFARMYASAKPATISQGVALDHCPNAVQSSRAVSLLIAITGNLDISGGNIYFSPLKQSNLRLKGNFSLDEAIGAQYPIFSQFLAETTAMPLTETLVTGRPYSVKALIVQGCNPALTWPNSEKVRQAFAQLDLLVVIDLFMTETAKMADVFLPAVAFPERKIMRDHFFEGVPLIVLGNKVVEPPPDCLEDWRIWAELGKRLGYGGYFPWRDTDELFAFLLRPSGITLEQLEQNPGGIFYHQPIEQRKYEKEGFATPSGKVEISSQILAEYGYDPLPTFPKEKQSEDYPLILISGSRINAFTHSQHRNIARLRKLEPEPRVDTHPDTAKTLGIADGDEVLVQSEVGSIRLKARLSTDVHPKVLSIQHGWAEANVNILTSDILLDPISAYPAFKTIPCQVRKIGE